MGEQSLFCGEKIFFMEKKGTFCGETTNFLWRKRLFCGKKTYIEHRINLKTFLDIHLKVGQGGFFHTSIFYLFV